MYLYNKKVNKRKKKIEDSKFPNQGNLQIFSHTRIEVMDGLSKSGSGPGNIPATRGCVILKIIERLTSNAAPFQGQNGKTKTLQFNYFGRILVY